MAAGGSFGAEAVATLSGGVDLSYTYGTEQGYTNEARPRGHQDVGRTTTTSQGSIRAALDLTNTSLVAFTVDSPTINVSAAIGRRVHGRSHRHARARGREHDLDARARGTRHGRHVEHDAAGRRAFGSSLKNPSSLVFAPGPLNLLTAGDLDFAFVESDVAAATARFIYVPGDDAPVEARIATNVARDDNGEAAGITLRDVLHRLDIPATEEVVGGATAAEGDTTAGVAAVAIGGKGPVFFDGTAPSLGDPPYVQTGGPGLRKLRQEWYPMVVRASDTVQPRRVPGSGTRAGRERVA